MKNLILLSFALMSLTFVACSPPSSNMELPTTPAPDAPIPKMGDLPKYDPPVAEPAPEIEPIPELPQPEVREDRRAELPVYPKIEPYKPEWITLDGGNSDLDFKPKVDILFLIDNSGSMKAAQENLSKSINSFARAFQSNRLIDYHLGVISVWDSKEKFVNHPGRKYDNGELRKVKINGREVEQRFLTRETGTPANLSTTIKIGIAGRAEGGTPIPEFEEALSPISAAIKLTGRGAKNEGFFREDAHLVVIVMSDADDTTSQIRPEQLAEELISFKGSPSKLSVYGVLVKATDPDDYKDYDLRVLEAYHPECFDRQGTKTVANRKRCPGFGPVNLEALIVAGNPESGTPSEIKKKHIVSLVQRDFGPDLAKIGSDISVKTLSKEIFLDQRPRTENDVPQIEVYYGTPEALAKGKGQKIPYRATGGWRYDPDHNSVKLAGNIEYKFQPGARFMVRMVPVIVNN